MARRATEINSLRSTLPNVLVLDTGSSLTGAQSGTGAKSDQLYAQVLESLHYDAVNAGPGELLATPTALKALTADGTALLSANASLASDLPAELPKNLLKPYVVKQVAGLKVGIVGVTAGGLAGASSQEIQPAKSAVDALRALLPEIHKQANLVVVLADLDPAGLNALANAGLAVQAILGAQTEAPQQPTVVGSTVVVNGGGYGYYVDRLTLTVAPDGRVLTYASEDVPLDARVKDDPTVAKLEKGFASQG